MYDIGSRVKWYDYYADGDIVRDAGYGLIVSLKEYSSKGMSSSISDYFVIYEVLKDGGHVESFEHFQLEQLTACT